MVEEPGAAAPGDTGRDTRRGVAKSDMTAGSDPGGSLLAVRNLAAHFPVTKGALFRRVIGRVKAVGAF